ncbi:hypothetical protein HY967_05040, partial [Candidatus Jorgensenbacteria bacterium]|nr:hypothetical protein [Candidatus Jorgensenbacteria bacterium]
MAIDRAIFDVFHQVVGGSSILDWLAIFLAQYLPYFLFIGTLIFFFRLSFWKNKLIVLFQSFLALILARGIVVEAIRFFYNRPRPFIALEFKPLVDATSYAFPSG